MTSASKPIKPPAALLLRAINDDSIEEDALDFLHDHAIPCLSGNRAEIIRLAYAHGWRESTPSNWRG